MKMHKCIVCSIELGDHDAYEYRGAFSCEDHFDDMINERDRQRKEIIREEDAKTRKLKGLDFGDNVVGKENRKLLKSKLDVASRESLKLKNYERPEG